MYARASELVLGKVIEVYVMRMVMLASLVLSASLLGACAGEEESVDEGSGAATARAVDPSKFFLVDVAIASGDDAKALDTALQNAHARTVKSYHFAGLSERELAGQSFDPNDDDPAHLFGILCQLDSEAGPTCALRAVVRKADVEGRTIEGTLLPTKAVISGKLAAAVAKSVPEYRPLGITCTKQGRDTRCTIPCDGFGMALPISEAPLTQEEATKLIKGFFPEA